MHAQRQYAQAHPVRDPLGAILLIAAFFGLLLAGGCGDDSPTAPPLPEPCPFLINSTPLAGAPGFHVLEASPAGEYTLSVNGTARSVEFGQLVTAQSGDVVQGCRPCGCSPAVVLR